MAINTKTRIYNGTPPYTLSLRNNGNLIHTVTGNDDRLEIPDSFITPLSGNMSFEIRDSNNNVNTTVIDKVSWNFMRSHHAGMSIANGNFNNHKNAITQSALRGIKFLGVLYHEDDVQDDAALIALGASTFNHTINHSSYQKGFDEVVRMAYQNGVQLRVGLWITRGRNSLNNGTTRTMFFDQSDAQLRENGEPTSKHNDQISAVVTGSYVSPRVRNFAYTLFKNFTKRYLAAIQDGTILAYGIVSQDTGEEEFQFTLRDENNAFENIHTELMFSRGDFQPNMVNGFKAEYPQYASLNNGQIGNSLLNFNEAALGNRWRRYMEKIRAKFITDMIDETLAENPGLTRAKFYQYDSSSLITQIARGNASPFQRFHKAALLVKSNDVTNINNFEMDYNLAAARSVSAMCVVEPTPGAGPAGSHDFVLWRDYVNYMITLCKERGIHISYITNDWNVIDSLNSQHGLLPLQAPKETSTYKSVNGRLVTQRFTKNLSYVYPLAYGGQNTSYNPFKAEYLNFLSTQGIVAADIKVEDDIN